jgi:hypothetical protein
MTPLEIYPKKGVNSIELGMNYETVRKNADCDFSSDTGRDVLTWRKDIDPGFVVLNPNLPIVDHFPALGIVVYYDDFGFCEHIILHGGNIRLLGRDIFLFESREFNSDDSVETLVSWLDSLGGNFQLDEDDSHITSDHFGISLELFGPLWLENYNAVKLLAPKSISVFDKRPQKR